MKVGIVGHGGDKFAPKSKAKALTLIDALLGPWDMLVSGRSPMGGVDVWAEEVADRRGLRKFIFEPKVMQWNPKEGYGYKARNEDVAKTSDELHVILVSKYPPGYMGARYSICYHCQTTAHVKSGACWTGKLAEKLGKRVTWHVIDQEKG